MMPEGLVLIAARQAREDALLLLSACAESYGAAALKPHLARIWSGLRLILAADINGSYGPEDKAEVRHPCEAQRRHAC